MNDPFAAPRSEPNLEAHADQLKRRRRFWKRAIWISLGGVLIPPVLGLAGTVAAMISQSSRTSGGDAEPVDISTAVAASVHFTMIGLLISFLSIVALIGVLIRYFTIPKTTEKSGKLRITPSDRRSP